MVRILKRSFIFIISFVLFFSMSVSVCFASDVVSSSNEPDPTGWSSWTTNEKISYVGKYGLDIICTVTGLLQGNQSGLDELIQDTFAAKDGYGVSSYYEFLATNLGFDDDTQTWELSDNLVDFCNTLIIDYNEKVSMIYRYPVRPECLDAAWFPNQSSYLAFVDAVESHPELYFYVSTTESHKIIDFYCFSSDVLSCINANFDLIYASCALYNSDWTQTFNVYHGRMTDGNTSFYCVAQNPSNVQSFDTFDDLLACNWNFDTTVPDSTLFRSDNVTWEINQCHWLVSSKGGAINCYKSSADMKKDLSSQFIGSYTDTYTGTPSQTITQSEVNNVVNNYYGGYPDDSGGGSSGSDDSGGSSSGGSSIIDGLGKLFGAIGNIIDKLFGFVLGLLSKVVDFFASILEMFTDTLTKLIDIIPSGFNEFLSAMFPYIPEEWIIIAEFILLVSAIGCVVALFKR